MKRLTARQGAELVLTLLGLAAILILVGNAISFVVDRNRLPARTTIADIDVSGLTAEQAISQTAAALSPPVALNYAGETVLLDPAAVDVRLNPAVARIQIDQILRRKQTLSAFPDHVLRKQLAERIPAPIVYSENKLTAFLLGVAARLDREPGVSAVTTDTLAAPPPQPGRALSVVDARDAVIAALGRSQARNVDLPIDVIGAGAASLKSLEAVLRQQGRAFTDQGGEMGVFVKNLRTGEELSINGDMAVSAPGWLRVVAAVEAARSGPDTLSSDAVRAALIDGSSLSANELLRVAGKGDAGAGLSNLNGFLRKFGALSTFLAQPFDQRNEPVNVITPANLRAGTRALDVNAQSTPAEIAALLEALNACKAGKGAFMVLARGALTGAECEQIMTVLSRNTAVGLMDANVGNAALAHRQNWDANTHADAGIVMTRDADYVLVIALTKSGAPLAWPESSALIGALTRATHAYFNGGVVPPAGPALTSAPVP